MLKWSTGWVPGLQMPLLQSYTFTGEKGMYSPGTNGNSNLVENKEVTAWCMPVVKVVVFIPGYYPLHKMEAALGHRFFGHENYS
jgi:hypothetical protein